MDSDKFDTKDKVINIQKTMDTWTNDKLRWRCQQPLRRYTKDKIFERQVITRNTNDDPKRT
jgi:hypothetical protein